MRIIGVDVSGMIKEDRCDYARAYSLGSYTSNEFTGLQKCRNSKFCGMFFKEKEFEMPEKKKIYKIWKKIGDGDMSKFWWCIKKFHLQGMLQYFIVILT